MSPQLYRVRHLLEPEMLSSIAWPNSQNTCRPQRVFHPSSLFSGSELSFLPLPFGSLGRHALPQSSPISGSAALHPQSIFSSTHPQGRARGLRPQCPRSTRNHTTRPSRRIRRTSERHRYSGPGPIKSSTTEPCLERTQERWNSGSALRESRKLGARGSGTSGVSFTTSRSEQ
jgi:hypothetical protein